MFFNSTKKLFPFLKYSNFCPDIFGPVGKRLYMEEAKDNPKIYDIMIRSEQSHIF